jgi:hypothetical protein
MSKDIIPDLDFQLPIINNQLVPNNLALCPVEIPSDSTLHSRTAYTQLETAHDKLPQQPHYNSPPQEATLS